MASCPPEAFNSFNHTSYVFSFGYHFSNFVPKVLRLFYLFFVRCCFLSSVSGKCSFSFKLCIDAPLAAVHHIIDCASLCISLSSIQLGCCRKYLSRCINFLDHWRVSHLVSSFINVNGVCAFETNLEMFYSN